MNRVYVIFIDEDELPDLVRPEVMGEQTQVIRIEDVGQPQNIRKDEGDIENATDKGRDNNGYEFYVDE